MLSSIALIAAVLVAALLAYAATKPDTFKVQRSALIKATPEKLFAIINDFHNWGRWSPWNKHDPNIQVTHSGAPNGKGAVYEWEGNNKVGKGRIEILDTLPPNKITMKLDMLSPMEGHNTVVYTIEPQGGQAGQSGMTSVTWAMHGPATFVSKVMGTIFNMDKMVGGAFDEGLASLKTIAEA